jgi:uncharacterized phage protein (TIGR01671 family)
MREIKFRFWDALDEKMLNDIDIEEYTLHALRDFEGEILQYTGLKDKNGVEIYEGDVVKIETFNPQIYQVGFDRGGFCFYNEGDSYYHDVKYLDKCTVIGNIFQNPELLGKAVAE